MAIEIKGENFQSWEKFHLVAESGKLTVVVGQSNIGKSAMTRALKGMLRNSVNAGQIRVGTPGVKIEASIGDTKVSVERPKKGSTSYVIDGKEYSKLQKSIPEEITNLGMGVIEIGKIKLDATFAGQFDSQFMLDRTDEELTAILGAFSSSEQLENGKRVANGRIAERNSEAKVLAKNKQATAEMINSLDGLTARLESIRESIDLLEPIITRAEKIITLITELIQHLDRLEALRSMRESLNVPEMEQVAQSSSRVQVLSSLVEAKSELIRMHTALSCPVPDPEPLTSRVNLVTELAQLIDARKAHQRITDLLFGFVVPDTTPTITSYKLALYAGHIIDGRLRSENAGKALEAISACVTTWTSVVESTTLYRAITGALDSMEARKNSKVGKVIKDLDSTLAGVALLSTDTALKVIQDQTLKSLIEAMQKQESYAKMKQENATLLAEAEEFVTKCSHDRAVTCPKCGYKIEVEK